MSGAPRVTLYPRHCFHLSPTVNTWCLLRATEIHDLDQHAGFEGENFYFYKNLPIKWVRIVGVIVSIDENTGRRFYTVDDGSGKCIQALVALPVIPNTENGTAPTTEQNTVGKNVASEAESKATQNLGPYTGIDIGDVVDIKGLLSTFREERQLNIEKMVALRTTAQEVALWERRAKFRHDVLNVPWVLRDKDIRRCRREAERSEAEAERKKRRLKLIIEGEAAQRQKRPARDTIRSKSRENGEADSVQSIIRNGAPKGKYNALGL